MKMNESNQLPQLLQYPSRHDSFLRPLQFACICPESSRTRADQRTPSTPHGLTVVALVPANQAAPFESAITAVSGAGHNFMRAKKLHFTIRGLFFNEPWNPEWLDQIRNGIEAFFQQRKHSGLRVSFDLVRPGLIGDRPECSNGTAVALTSEASTQEVLDLSNGLAAFLSRHLPAVFPEPPGKKLPGVWCTLGYFDHADFPIDARVADAFASGKTFQASVSPTELTLMKFSLKSLADGEAKGAVPLGHA